MTNIDKTELLRRLSEPFPEEAIERSRASQNGKGYDTTGVRVQFVINRLNEVLGLGGFRVERAFLTRERATRSGATMFEVICDLSLQLGTWEHGVFVAFAETQATGGHVAPFEADARKGAHSNALKKAAAAFGIGWRFYAGIADDDHAVPPEAREAPAEGASIPPATEPQRATIARLVKAVGGNQEEFAAHVERTHGVRMEDLDRRTASTLIGELQDAVRRRSERRAG
ncbi:MAG: hypothetical protein H6716_25225 [Polyangiaceae bacterium]|nr:hypothetical protein [Polyangiaceae bacterium]